MFTEIRALHECVHMQSASMLAQRPFTEESNLVCRSVCCHCSLFSLCLAAGQQAISACVAVLSLAAL